MNPSEASGLLTLTLSASGNRHAESIVIPRMVRQWPAPPRGGCPSGAPRFLLNVAFGMTDCWYWAAYTDALGYGRCAFPEEPKAHRASWRLFVGDIPQGMSVLHRCDVRNCVNPDHLFLGTQADNVADMMSKGRSRVTPLHGEANPHAKLTWAAVDEMRALRASGASVYSLAKRYGVSKMTARRAVTGDSWRVRED